MRFCHRHLITLMTVLLATSLVTRSGATPEEPTISVWIHNNEGNLSKPPDTADSLVVEGFMEQFATFKHLFQVAQTDHVEFFIREKDKEFSLSDLLIEAGDNPWQLGEESWKRLGMILKQQQFLAIAHKFMTSAYLEYGLSAPRLKITIISWGKARETLEWAIIHPEVFPDLMQLGSTWLPYCASNNLLRDLDERTIGIKAEAWIRQSWDACHYNNQWFAYPWFVDIRGILYRADILEKYQISPDDLEDLDYLTAACEKLEALRVRNQLKISAVFAVVNRLKKGYVENNLLWDIFPLLWSKQTMISTTYGYQHMRNLGQEAVTTLAKWMFIGFHYGQRNEQVLTSHEIIERFFNGDYVMVITPPGIIGRAKEAVAEGMRFGLTRPPKGSFIGGSVIVFPRREAAELQPASYSFAQYLSTNVQAQLIYTEGAGALPSFLNALYDPRILSDPLSRAYQQIAASQWLYSPPPIPEWFDIEKLLVETELPNIWQQLTMLTENSSTVEFNNNRLEAAIKSLLDVMVLNINVMVFKIKYVQIVASSLSLIIFLVGLYYSYKIVRRYQRKSIAKLVDLVGSGVLLQRLENIGFWSVLGDSNQELAAWIEIQSRAITTLKRCMPLYIIYRKPKAEIYAIALQWRGMQPALKNFQVELCKRLFDRKKIYEKSQYLFTEKIIPLLNLIVNLRSELDAPAYTLSEIHRYLQPRIGPLFQNIHTISKLSFLNRTPTRYQFNYWLTEQLQAIMFVEKKWSALFKGYAASNDSHPLTALVKSWDAIFVQGPLRRYKLLLESALDQLRERENHEDLVKLFVVEATNLSKLMRPFCDLIVAYCKVRSYNLPELPTIPLFAGNGIKCQTVPNLERLLIDKDDFDEIIKNLMTNSAHAGATQILVDIEISGNTAEICYQDNGRGMEFEEILTFKTKQHGGAHIIRSHLINWYGRDCLEISSMQGAGAKIVFRLHLS